MDAPFVCGRAMPLVTPAVRPVSISNIRRPASEGYAANEEPPTKPVRVTRSRPPPVGVKEPLKANGVAGFGSVERQPGSCCPFRPVETKKQTHRSHLPRPTRPHLTC